MKKVLLIILVIGLFSFVGCSKGTKTEDGKTEYTCVKKGVNQSSSVSGHTWKEDLSHTAKLDDNQKLTYYVSTTFYMYNSKEDCDYWCDVKVDWNDEINKNNYSGGHRETTCKCENNEILEKYIYDDIPNLSSILRSDIKELKSDNTFDLDTWTAKYEKYGYNCN